MKRTLLIFLVFLFQFAFFSSLQAATYSGSVSYQVIPGTNQYWSYPGTVCSTVTNSTAITFFLPAKTDAEFNSFLSHLPLGIATSSCTASCAASGGCGITAHNGTCTTYSASSVTSPSACSSIARTSTCNNGSWSVAPYTYSSCTVNMRSCAASGGCGVTTHGGSCTSYSSQNPSGAACSTVSRTSTCSDGSWSTTPYAYSSCSAGCAASGACSAASNGGTCNTYSTSATTYPTACPSAQTSTCSNGSWSPTPYANASCTAGTPVACAASGGCGVTAHGGSCTTYSSTAPIGAACSTVVRTSTCNNGSWSSAPYFFSTCVSGCAASGACGAAIDSGTCTSYSASSVSYPSSCSSISSTCSNGSWSPAPGSSAVCSVNHNYSWGAWGTCGGGNITRTCYDNGSAVVGSLCTAAIGGLDTRSCSSTYVCKRGYGPYGCVTDNGTNLANTGAVPAGEPFASCASGGASLLCANATITAGGNSSGCYINISGFTKISEPGYSSCYSGVIGNCPTARSSTAIMNCYGGYAWSTGTWGACGSGCTQTRSVTCVNQADGSTVADSYCTGTKPGTSQSCSGGSCVAPTVIYGGRLDGLSSTVCQGYSSSISSVQLPTDKTKVVCSYDYEAPYNNFTGGNPATAWDANTGTCSAWFQCQGGVLNGACGQYLGWCNQFNMRARLEFY